MLVYCWPVVTVLPSVVVFWVCIVVNGASYANGLYRGQTGMCTGNSLVEFGIIFDLLTLTEL